MFTFIGKYGCDFEDVGLLALLSGRNPGAPQDIIDCFNFMFSRDEFYNESWESNNGPGYTLDEFKSEINIRDYVEYFYYENFDEAYFIGIYKKGKNNFISVFGKNIWHNLIKGAGIFTDVF